MMFYAVSHPERLSPSPLRLEAVSAGSRQDIKHNARLSWQHGQQSPGGGRLPMSASATAPCWLHLEKLFFASINMIINSVTPWHDRNNSNV